MQVSEIIRTCSHSQIAQAALASIGGDLLFQVKLAARNHGMDTGAYAADLVRAFANGAKADEIRLLSKAMSGTDQPILFGFRHIVETAIDRQNDCLNFFINPVFPEMNKTSYCVDSIN